MVAALALAAAFLIPLQAKSPITHETLWMMKRVTSPVVSPDGRWVAFTLIEPNYDPANQSSDLWLVPADGSAAARRLTSSKGGEGGAAWSPDSRRIAFSAKREGDEVNQIYVIDVVTGGEAQRVTAISTGAGGPQWSPDGKSLLFPSRVYPGTRNEEENKKAAAERKGRKYRARVYDAFPIRNWDTWMDDLQTHLMVQAVNEPGKHRDLLAGSALVNEKGFAGATTPGSDELQAVWAPDGQSVVFTAMTNRHEAARAETVLRLYTVPVGGGEPKVLTPGAENSYSHAQFSPDRKWLYVQQEPNNRKIYNLTRLTRFAWPAMGAPQVVSGRADLSVNSVALSADSRTVYMTAEDKGNERVFSIPAAGGEPKVVVQEKNGTFTALQAPEQGAFLIGLWGSAVQPAEVVRIDPATGAHRFLTSVNREKAAEIDWQPLRHFTFSAKNGRTIHNMMALPPGFDESRKYPLLVLIHGGPHTMWRDEITLRWNYHLLAANGYVVLLTNYTGSTGFGEKFAQVMLGDPLRGPGEELNEAADEAIKRYAFIDGSRQCAGGASYGGHLANWLQATTTRYRCLISHAGLINMESQWGTSDSIYHREIMAGGPVWEQGKVWKEQNPIRFAANFKTPILLTVGENDFRVPLNQTLENWSVLQRLGITSRLIVFPDANHWILKPEDSRFFYDEVSKWLNTYLK
ncbi:MAG: S9 family peptidase [Bryobacterales bacterium]|nr:S9 family peptidase [Bryobacterales bacterium]